MTETELFKELRDKLGEDTSEKLIDFIQDSQKKRFEERWDQLVTKDFFHQQLAELRSDIHNDMNSLRADTRKEIDSLRADIHNDMNSLRVDTRKEIGSLRSEMHTEIGGLRADTRKDIDSLRTEMMSFQAAMHREFRTQLRWLLPLLFGQLGVLLALLVKVFLQD